MTAREGSRVTALWSGDVRTTRRDLLVGSSKIAAAGTLAAVLAGHGIRLGYAQGTPVSGAALGYPEVTATLSDQAVTLSVDTVPAGYVLLTVVNNSKDSSGAGAVGPGPGQTMQDLERAAATPTPNNGFPPFLYTATIPGGPGNVDPGQTGQAVVKLDAGQWAIIGENQAPAFLTATAGTPSAAQEPASSLTVTEQDFAFVGLDKPVAAGKQTWKVVNEGKQPHMLVLGQVPAGTTMEQIMQVVMLPDNATPPPGGLQQSDFHDRGGIILQSTGQTVWPILDLPAGRYVALCFVTDPKTGKPHAMEGMVSVFDVGAAGTPGA